MLSRKIWNCVVLAIAIAFGYFVAAYTYSTGFGPEQAAPKLVTLNQHVLVAGPRYLLVMSGIQLEGPGVDMRYTRGKQVDRIRVLGSPNERELVVISMMKPSHSEEKKSIDAVFPEAFQLAPTNGVHLYKSKKTGEYLYLSEGLNYWVAVIVDKPLLISEFRAY